MTPWTPTRAEALHRLDDFLPRAGRHYAEMRNFDMGPDNRSNVAVLSPYIRHRLIREDEIVAAVLQRHTWSASEKFLQEVCWRTYWKGWLELRPSVWNSYRSELDKLLHKGTRNSNLMQKYDKAITGESGIACVDLWARELIANGYLHNHVRMWFASLWIFTLQLPWALGADFFYRHLMDGDPASNTLSWRWVAGLQTRGKTYAATAGNIARYTEGRIRPQEDFADPCVASEGPPLPAAGRLPKADRPAAEPAVVLLTEEDLDVSSWDLGGARPVAVVGIRCTEDRSPLPVGPVLTAFATGALQDGLERASAVWNVPGESSASWDTLVEWVKSQGVRQVITAFAAVGPVRDRLVTLARALDAVGVRLVQIRRPWDDVLWPHATAGFFPFKEKLPRELAALGLVRPY